MKKIKLSSAIALIILAVATTINGTLIVSHEIVNKNQGNYQEMQKKVSKLYEVMSVIDTYYVGEVNERDALDGASTGYVANMGDKWSYYLSAEQYKEYKEDNKKNLVGIGVNVSYDAEKKAILVTNVYKNSPAEEAGIQKFDYITAVDSKEVSVVGYYEAVDLVRGEEDSKVKITIERDGTKQTLTIERKSIEKVSVNHEMIDNNIGYIEISEFDISTGEQFEKALETLKAEGAEGYIIDVRNNPGGLLTQLVETLDILLPEGDIISTVSKAGEEQVYESDADHLNMPLVVLANENSISAAEFFAAAVSEYGVGTIVGTKTSGKGYTQQPMELSDGSAIVLSTNKYYTPKGKNLANTGVTPDITVNLTAEEQDRFHYLTSADDPQIIRAIEEVKLKILK